MKEVYKRIWEAAEHMQDLRLDKGHAKIVTSFAIKINKILKGNEEIVIPAAILHDIGYYAADKGVLFLWCQKKLPENKEVKLKELHMNEGARFAKEILEKINYPKKNTNQIIKIIARHDLKNSADDLNELIVRDADKLWRFSKTGFWVDIKRANRNPDEWIKHLSKNIIKKNYFYTNTARELAKTELRKRRKEALKINCN